MGSTSASTTSAAPGPIDSPLKSIKNMDSADTITSNGPPGWTGRNLRVYSREELKHLIVKGEVIVLHRSLLYRLNTWLPHHPGGPLALLHFVGRDATLEIEAYHTPHIIKRMKPFVIGRVSPEEWDAEEGGEGWKPLVPPVEAGLWPPGEEEKVGNEGDDSGYSSVEEEVKEEKATDKKKGVKLPPFPKPVPGAPTNTHLPLCDRLALLEPPTPLTKEESGYDMTRKTQHQLYLSYLQLHEVVKSKGYYTAPKLLYGYGPDLIRYTILFTIFLLTSPAYPFLSHLSTTSPAAWQDLESTNPWWYLVSAVFLGLWWHQITFTAHDAGHSGVTGKWWVDRFLAILIADFVGGISIGWWCDSHDVHHLVTNHPEHDPDIQHMPFFAISTKFFGNLWSTYYQRSMVFDAAAKRLVSWQHRLYYFVMMFGRFNLFVNSWVFLTTKAQPGLLKNLEICGIAFFWTYFGTLLYLLPSNGVRVMYTLVSFAVTSPLHIQIVLSHFAQSTADLGPTESFPHRQIRTTMDVTCPPYLDFLHGGLHMQVTHHLFPRLPRHNLRSASEDVQKWCREQGLEYRSFEFGEGNRRVLSVLEEVGRQVRVLGVVAEKQAKGELGH